MVRRNPRGVENDGPKAVTIQAGSLPVVYEHLDYLRSVIVGAWVQVGSRYERRKEYGYSHFVEHMLFKGTKKGKIKRNAHDIAASLESLGGELNAFTSREYSCYYARAASRHFSTAMEVLGDVVLHSQFPAHEYEKEKSVVLEEIRMYEDSPEELSHELLQSTMFSDALGHPIVGSAKTIGEAKRKDVLDYYKRMYQPGRMFLTVLGNVPIEELQDELRHFQPIVNGKAHRKARITQTKVLGGRRLVRKPIEQLHLCFGVRGLPMDHPDRYTLHLINTYLGAGMSSRLFQEVREKRGLAYSVYSFIQSFHDTGLWGFYCATSPNKGEDVRHILEAELEILQKKGIAAKTIERLKEQMVGGLLLGLEKTSFRMTRLAVGRLFFGNVVPVDQVIGMIDSVSVADVKRVARELLKGWFSHLCCRWSSARRC